MNAPDLLTWRKARRSGGEGGNCIEVAGTLAAVRDSKNPAEVLTVPVAGMLTVVKAGTLDR